MRAVVDHHVDRLGMYAQQCAQSTNTNRSIGLIRFSRSMTEISIKTNIVQNLERQKILEQKPRMSAIRRSGGVSAR
jgi:hypothetical protein